MASERLNVVDWGLQTATVLSFTLVILAAGGARVDWLAHEELEHRFRTAEHAAHRPVVMDHRFIST